MSHTINIKAAGSCFGFNQLSDAVVTCHSSSDLVSDATTVVILKTSSLQPTSAEISVTTPTTSIVVLNNKSCSSSSNAPANVIPDKRQQHNSEYNVPAAACAILAVRDGKKQQASFDSSPVRDKKFSPKSAGIGGCTSRPRPVTSVTGRGTSIDAVFPGKTVRTAVVADDASRSDEHRPVTSILRSTVQTDESPGKTVNCRGFIGCGGGRVSATAPVVDKPSVNTSSCNASKSNSCSETASVHGEEERKQSEKLDVDRRRNGGVSDDGAPIMSSSGRVGQSAVKANLCASISRRRSKQVTTASNLSEPKRAPACNPFVFTTSPAPDASAFQFLCQSCQMVRFATYWELRLHEDWCGRRNPSTVGMSCQKCGFRYKNLVLLHRHAVEVHGSGNKDEVVSPDMHRAPTNANQYSFTTVGAPDAVDFPYVCASCSIVCFRSYAEMRRHEDWCGRNTQNGSFVCGTCKWAFHNDVLLGRHERDCAAGGPASEASASGGYMVNQNNDESPECLSEVTKVRSNVIVASVDGAQKRLSSSRKPQAQGSADEDPPGDAVDPIPSGKRAKPSHCNGPFCCMRCDALLDTRLELARHKRHCKETGAELGAVDDSLRASANCSKSKDLGAKSDLAANVTKKLNRRTAQKAIGASTGGCVRCLDCGEQLKSRLLLTRHKRNGTCRKSANSRGSSCKGKCSRKMQKRAGDEFAGAKCQRLSDTESRVIAEDDDDDTATSAQTERQLEVNNDEMNVRTRKSSCKRITKQLKKKHFTAEVKVQSCTVDSPSEVKPPAASIPMSVPATDVKPGSEVADETDDACRRLIVEALNKCTSKMTITETEQSAVKGVCECKVVLDRTVILHRTADVKSGMIGSSFDTEKTSMLRALDLIPVAGCVSDQNDVVVDRNAISADGSLRRSCRRRKHKRVWTSTSDIDLLRPLDQVGDSARVSHKPVAATTSVGAGDDIPRQRQTGCGKSGPVKAKRTEQIKKKNTKIKNVMTTIGKDQQKKSSLRTLETINDNALRCVACGILLRTVRQIIAHVCRS
jgi:hypothetical protein